MRLIRTLIAVALVEGCISASAQVPCPRVPTNDGPCYDAAQCNYEKCIAKNPTYQCYLKLCTEVWACDQESTSSIKRDHFQQKEAKEV